MTARSSLSLSELYDRDYLLWLEITAEQLKRGDFDAMDRENLIEEIESMGRSERRAIESLLTRLMEHLLKVSYGESEKEQNANHWRGEITNFRIQVARELTATTLRNYAREFFPEAYTDARKIVVNRKIADPFRIPTEPPFTLEQVLNENWFPPEENR